MRIGINTRFLIDGKMEGIGWYTFEITKRLIENHPEHEFILFYDRPWSEKFEFGNNSKNVLLRPQARHPFLFKIWFDYSVTRALKKHKIDLFFSPDGYLSLKTDIPQIPVIHDINFEHFPEDLPNKFLKYYKTNFPLFAEKAKNIITVSNYSKEDIISTYRVDEAKITSIWNGASDSFHPASSEEEIITTRKKYCEGKPYFLFVGALHPRKNLKRLIEAYNKYCNYESDPMQLVIVGAELWKNSKKDINGLIKNQNIHLTGRLPISELSAVMRAAEVFVFVPYFEGFGIPLVEAMKSGIPIIAGNKTSLPEIAGEAAIYCDPFDPNDISARLSELSSSREMRNELSSKGLNRAEIFSWDVAAQEVWKVIEKSV